jgi:hypothetical protein
MPKSNENKESTNIYNPFHAVKKLFQYMDFKTKMNFRKTCKKYYEKLHIQDFYYIERKYLNRLTDDILINHKKIKYLNAYGNINITNVNNMQKLEILDASSNYFSNSNPKICGIKQEGLQLNTNLKKLIKI